MMLISLSFIILHLSFSRVAAQDVSVTVNPVQQVLPPQAGQYVDNPGKFFNVRVVNNTDERQLLYFGMHIDMLFPEEQRMVATPTDNRHIPRQPITLEPRASKVLNPVEMKLLFSHYELTEIYIRDGMYNDYKRGIFGLMPEGQFRLYMHAYKWNPELTTAVPSTCQRTASASSTSATPHRHRNSSVRSRHPTAIRWATSAWPR